MSILVLGLVLFFGAHSVSIVNAAWRDRLAASIGEWTWKGVYSIVALAGFVLMVWGYGLARHDPTVLYVAPAWLRYVTLILMAVVFPLLTAAYLPGRIKNAVGHPMLMSTMIWAAAHLLVNGTLADVVLFGAFLVWALADRISYRYREPRAVIAAPAAPLNDGIAVGAGLVVYALFVFWLHRSWFGVPVLG